MLTTQCQVLRNTSRTHRRTQIHINTSTHLHSEACTELKYSSSFVDLTPYFQIYIRWYYNKQKKYIPNVGLKLKQKYNFWKTGSKTHLRLLEIISTSARNSFVWFFQNDFVLVFFFFFRLIIMGQKKTSHTVFFLVALLRTLSTKFDVNKDFKALRKYKCFGVKIIFHDGSSLDVERNQNQGQMICFERMFTASKVTLL